MARRAPGMVSDTIFRREKWCQTPNALRVDDAQREGPADRLGAIEDVQLAQGLLHVVLDRERADLEDHADLDVALAVVDPLQDLLLARGEETGLHRFHAGALERPGDLAAHPARV